MSSATLQVAPSVLAADFGHLVQELEHIQEAGADWLHLDIMDGRFVPNLSFGFPVIETIRKHSRIPLDVHLMIVEPDRYLEAFAQAGAAHITVHAETCPHLERTLQHIRSLGCKAGVALNPSTPLHVLEHVYHTLDLVLIMTVNPGFGGQSFIPQMLPKIECLAQRIAERPASSAPIAIAVDGGVSPQNASALREAGADVLIAGSAIFSHPTSAYASRIEAIRQGVA
ncbi:MAG: ribulose-phosphate 3-epimerase [Myxococcota bacterium]